MPQMIYPTSTTGCTCAQTVPPSPKPHALIISRCDFGGFIISDLNGGYDVSMDRRIPKAMFAGTIEKTIAFVEEHFREPGE